MTTPPRGRTYRAKQPCKYGHEPVRYLSNSNCVECSKIAAKKFALLCKDERTMTRERRAFERAKARYDAALARLTTDALPADDPWGGL